MSSIGRGGGEMGWFDWLRKAPPPEDSLDRIAIDVASFLIPDLIFNDYEEYSRVVSTMGDSAGTFFYIGMAGLLNLPLDREAGRRFVWKVGELEGAFEYHALEYPTPLPLVDENDVCVSTNPAPYFSALISRPGSSAMRYFILEQTFVAGRTTLREKVASGPDVPGGQDYNLGPGPAPTLEEFLEAIRRIADPLS